MGRMAIVDNTAAIRRRLGFSGSESSSGVSQEEYPCRSLPLAAKLRSLAIDENLTVFFFDCLRICKAARMNLNLSVSGSG
eukprot:scaffold23717_cov78-Skeletonema_dohrnii-CCMP3373.AAC.1